MNKWNPTGVVQHTDQIYQCFKLYYYKIKNANQPVQIHGGFMLNCHHWSVWTPARFDRYFALSIGRDSREFTNATDQVVQYSVFMQVV